MIHQTLPMSNAPLVCSLDGDVRKRDPFEGTLREALDDAGVAGYAVDLHVAHHNVAHLVV